MNVESEIQSIFRQVLNEPKLELQPNFSSWDLPAWDSLANAQILLEIQSQFSIQFTGGEALELKTAGDIINLVKKKLE